MTGIYRLSIGEVSPPDGWYVHRPLIGEVWPGWRFKSAFGPFGGSMPRLASMAGGAGWENGQLGGSGPLHGQIGGSKPQLAILAGQYHHILETVVFAIVHNHFASEAQEPRQVGQSP
ncbi:hypothetical protein PCANC_03585 [Puccinia coronata f. sp. avenae]|uniref:Uncharacterized protein n=1 Tax=Puccinia coronata f. sp. avenae TaxID=200324 RepID=A0A2N5S591_9BASI|nr:hypothetical protein PCANC_26306 [Puccinia coronata f. sp. avenae]PLW53829.1 hypothetical protein PCANC_03585 [Puccinia coronata f. sp. avenae]